MKGICVHLLLLSAFLFTSKLSADPICDGTPIEFNSAYEYSNNLRGNDFFMGTSFGFPLPHGCIETSSILILKAEYQDGRRVVLDADFETLR